MPETAGNI